MPSPVCECELAGYCSRHGIKKNKTWHKLCQTQEKYRTAWDSGNGPGQEQEQSKRAERRKRIELAIEGRKRLTSWLTFFRHQSDTGIGDTCQRLSQSPRPARLAKAAIARLMKQCDCKPVDAVERLNKDYPYTASS